MDPRAQARPAAAYTPLQKVLHWIIALAVVGLFPVGKIMADRGAANIWDALTNTLYSWHKLIGFTVLCLMLVRLVLRLKRGAPALPASLSHLEKTVATVVHAAIYVLLLAVPLSGWAGVTAFPALITVGGFHLPPMPFVPVNADLAKQIFAVHGPMAMALVALALGHIGAALMHLVVKKDGVFQRMWPGRG